LIQNPPIPDQAGMGEVHEMTNFESTKSLDKNIPRDIIRAWKNKI